MKILIVSQYFPPESALIPSAVAEGLSGRGHKVKVLTGFPNYPEGELFEGYEMKWREKSWHGEVEVLRVPLYANHSEHAIRRSLNYVSFGLSAATARRYARDADVIYVYATQMTPALGPWLWKITGGAPYVLHVQDLWPDSITGSSLVKGGLAARVVNGALTPWLRSVYHRSAGVIGIAPTMVETLVERGVSPTRAHLVYNWAELYEMQEAQREEHAEGTNFLFAGNVGAMQDIETVLKTASLTKSTGARFTIVGDGVALDRMKKMAIQMELSNVEFRGRTERSLMAGIYAEADYALVTLKDLPIFSGTIPSKFQAALGYGVPIVSNVPGDVGRLIDEWDLGFRAEPENPESLARAVKYAIDAGSQGQSALSTNATSLYEKLFAKETSLASIEAILESVASSQ